MRLKKAKEKKTSTLYLLCLFLFVQPRIAMSEVDAPLNHTDTSKDFLPLSIILKKENINSAWDMETGILTLSYQDKTASLAPGSRRIVSGASVMTLTSAPFFKRDVLMAPVGFLLVLDRCFSIKSTPSAYQALAAPDPLNCGNSEKKGGAGCVESDDRTLSRSRVDRVFKTLVIDPGHGGKDSGASSRTGIKEKDVVLDIAKAVKKLVEQKIGIQVILTRSADYFVGLDDRTAIAANNRADLFISIHVNAVKQRRIRGFETYFMSQEPTDDEALAAVLKENSVIELEHKKIDVKSALAVMLLDMVQSEHIRSSAAFAMAIHESLEKAKITVGRGVKQAPFIVLANAAMPAVLIEAGFISNNAEARLLTKKETHQKIADAIFESVLNYKRNIEQRVSKNAYSSSQPDKP